MTKITLDIWPSEKGTGLFFCASDDGKFSLAVGHTLNEAKSEGELMLYKIKAAQDETLRRGRQPTAKQPLLEHPIEIEWRVMESQPESALDMARALRHMSSC